MNFKLMILLGSLVLYLVYPRLEDGLKIFRSKRFNIETDLLLLHYDCKTDVDDLHSVAAFFTIASHPDYSQLNYYAVAGAYGEQEGLYVPPNKLFRKAFGKNWSDADRNRESAIQSVKLKAIKTLQSHGEVWIAEAGQSDFSADLLKALQKEFPDRNISPDFHVVQHSDWNEEVTNHAKLLFIKSQANYHKISDGNVLDNGTPGFNSSTYTEWEKGISNPKVRKVWKLAIKLSDRYNGKDGRYLNESIALGGLDFSDTSEVCWILNIDHVDHIEDFFNKFNTNE